MKIKCFFSGHDEEIIGHKEGNHLYYIELLYKCKNCEKITTILHRKDDPWIEYQWWNHKPIK